MLAVVEVKMMAIHRLLNHRRSSHLLPWDHQLQAAGRPPTSIDPDLQYISQKSIVKSLPGRLLGEFPPRPVHLRPDDVIIDPPLKSQHGFLLPTVSICFCTRLLHMEGVWTLDPSIEGTYYTFGHIIKHNRFIFSTIEACRSSASILTWPDQPFAIFY
jgi:hypothetical protein